jgi:glycosyltransferase involved in cell wall biosynthesis
MNEIGESINLLSVVIPVRKMSGKLEFLISWLREEATKDIQVIIVHDQDSDSTGDELRGIISGVAPRPIRLLEGAYGNPGSARNAGLALVDTAWVAFWDSDDLPNVEEFLGIVELANDQEYECTVGSFNVFRGSIDGDHKMHLIEPKSETYLEEIAMNPGIWRWAFRKSIIENAQFLPIRMGEDVSFLAQLNLADRKIFLSPKIVYNYQIGLPGQLTSQRQPISDLLASIRFLVGKLPKSSLIMQRFISVLLCRQALTVMRKGKFQSKVGLVGFFLVHIPTLLRHAPPILRALGFVLKNRDPLGNR